MGYLLGDILVLSLRLVKRLTAARIRSLEVAGRWWVLGSGGRERWRQAIGCRSVFLSSIDFRE